MDPRQGPLEEVKQAREGKEDGGEARKEKREDLDAGEAFYVPASTQSFPTIKFLKQMPTVVKSESVGYTFLSNLFSHCSLCYNYVSTRHGSPSDCS